MKVTYEKLSDTITAINAIPQKDKDGNEINDSLTWAILRFSKKNKRALDNFAEEEMDINREHASIDDKKNILLNDKGGLMFTIENQKKLISKIKEWKLNSSIEIEPHICKDNSRISLLPIWVQDELDGILFNISSDIKEIMQD